MQLSEATIEHLKTAIEYMEARIKVSASSAMKSVIRKDIGMVRAELATR